jgi:hypothetical protein
MVSLVSNTQSRGLGLCICVPQVIQLYPQGAGSFIVAFYDSHGYGG